MLENRFWLKWILNYSLGELLVIGAATTVGRLVLIELSDFIAHFPMLVTWALVTAIGIGEGLTIGYFQWRSLSRLIDNLRAARWILVTTLATTFGWILIIPPSIFLLAFFVDFNLINKYYSVVYSLMAGAGFGGIVGFAQYLILRRFYHNAIVWFIANTISWMLSFFVIYFSVSILGGQHSLFYNVSVMITACICSGFIQGIVTGGGLHFLMSVKKPISG